MYNTLIEGHNALAGLGTCGLPDPFISHSKRGSKSASKPVDYFNVYGSDSSEGDDNIEKLLSPEKSVDKHNESTTVTTNKSPLKTSGNGSKAIQADSLLMNTSIPAHSTDMDHHDPPTSSNEHASKHNDSAVGGDEMEFVNPLLDDKDDQQTTVDESESEWEKELKLKRDQKAVDQSSSVMPNQQTVPVVDQKQAPPVDDKQLTPTDNSSVSEVLTEPSSHTHCDNNKEQIPLENNNNNNKVTRSLKDDTNIQHDRIRDEHPSPASSKEASSTLPVSPSTVKDMEASKRYEQKQNELLLVLEGRRKQLENTRNDKISGNTSVKSSTRVDEELGHISRPSINELRSTWEGQQQVTGSIMPPLHNKSTNKVELEPLKSSLRSSEMDNSHHLLNTGNVTDVVTATIKDQALFQQPVVAKTSGSSEILFSEEQEHEEEEESDALPQNANNHLDSSAMPDVTSQPAVKSSEVEKMTGATNSDEQRQQSLLSPLDQSEQSFSSNKSVEKQHKSPVMAGGEETERDKQFQQVIGKLVEGQDNGENDRHEEHVTNPSSDIIASDQRTTPTNERITNDNGAQKHPTDDSDDMILNGSISLSSQHTTTDLSTTHNIVSPIPFLSSSLPRPSTMTGYGRPTSSLLGK